MHAYLSMHGLCVPLEVYAPSCLTLQPTCLQASCTQAIVQAENPSVCLTTKVCMPSHDLMCTHPLYLRMCHLQGLWLSSQHAQVHAHMHALAHACMQDPRLSPQARSARRSGEEMSLVAAIFSFVFGDGDPNADFEEKRWRALGTLIQARCVCVCAHARVHVRMCV